MNIDWGRIKAMDITTLRDTILEATLPNVLFDGWTDHALRSGTRAAGLGPDTLAQAFPEGAADAVIHFREWTDRRLATAYRTEDTTGLNLNDRVALAIRLRLQAIDAHKQATQTWLGWLALPHHAKLAARLHYQTIEEIRLLVGDNATGISLCTKRTLLAGIYGATLLHWLGDDSEGHAATWNFLARSLDAATGLGQNVAKLGVLSKALWLVPSPVRFARQIRRRAAGRV